ncbi:HAD family hydrolase [Cellulomonas iranensis]|uniref:FMN phosphatase YigB (HAD superfamily) n=1 Tax=Cellulomonas iranensis TaxID=76862 RepID=A0ABU0GQX0_9CELL|nr:HAD family hydrolase [Cellulomonas iranensis]MDQ0427015.1 FMN phosphatase YigB (HAD superfamily) [Cellulomonas iranensis]
MTAGLVLTDLRAVVFDVGETLVDESRAWSEQARVAGVTPFSLMAAIGSVISQGRDHRDAWALLGAAPPDSVPDIGRGDLYPDALECLRAVGQAGLVVGVAGNQPSGAEVALTTAGVHVDFVAASATWGVAKPSLAFFRRVVAETQADPHRVFYVGDRLDNDIRPARAAGLRTAWLRRGPWAYLQQPHADEVRPDIELRDLTQLTEVLKRSTGGR